MIDVSKLLPEFRPLLAEDRLNELGPGMPNTALRAQLDQAARAVLPKAKSRDFAAACLAGLWLYHDFLDESHTLSQDIDTVEGSYWHGIMHRREPDYWNSKYWFRRVPRHPIFHDLRSAAATLAEEAGTPPGSAFLLQQKDWDPAAFVDLCEAAARGPAGLDRLCRQIQRREWDLLFQFCHERAF